MSDWSINQLRNQVRMLVTSGNNDSHIQRFQEINGRYKRFNSSEAFVEFISSFVREEQAKFERGDRRKPPCDCRGLPCALQRGEIPSYIQGRSGGFGSRDEGTMHKARRYTQKHTKERVITEALEEWQNEMSRIETDFLTLMRDARAEKSADTELSMPSDG